MNGPDMFGRCTADLEVLRAWATQAPKGTVPIALLAPTLARNAAPQYWIWCCPVRFVAVTLDFAMRRHPAWADDAKLTVQTIMARALRVTPHVRTPARKGIAARGSYSRQRALTWATQWLCKGCTGEPLGEQFEGLRTAWIDKKSGAVAVYRPERDDMVMWLAPPPWRETDNEIPLFNRAYEVLCAADKGTA